MMESNENELRRSADREFIESLNQLENILNEAQTEQINKTEQPLVANDTSPQPNEPSDRDEIDLAAWEDAVADIEQFLERQTKPE